MNRQRTLTPLGEVLEQKRGEVPAKSFAATVLPNQKSASSLYSQIIVGKIELSPRVRDSIADFLGITPQRVEELAGYQPLTWAADELAYFARVSETAGHPLSSITMTWLLIDRKKAKEGTG